MTEGSRGRARRGRPWALASLSSRSARSRSRVPPPDRKPDFALVKLEGDAVFAAAPAARLDGQGDRVLEKLEATFRAFTDGRTRALPASDHLCTASRGDRLTAIRQMTVASRVRPPPSGLER
jgi:hypothetical protein